MLIQFDDIEKEREQIKAAKHVVRAARFINENVAEEIGYTIGDIVQGEDIHFATGARWSLHDLIVYLIKQTGPVDLYFCTYAIKQQQANLFARMQELGLLMNIYSLVHYRIVTHDAAVLPILEQISTKMGYMRTHGKVTVLKNDTWAISIVGSANLTANTQADVGVITNNAAITDTWIEWITKNINNDLDTRTIEKP